MTAPRTPAVEAVGLEVRRADRVVVQRLDLRVPAGSMVAVTGPSGSGKSTLLGALAGVERPTSGTVSVDGSEIADRDTAAALGVMYLPQAGSLVSTLSAAENVVVALLAHGVASKEAAGRAREALALVGLEDERTHLSEELSGGQQQRAALAVMLALRPRVLLLDEPTSELDAVNRQRVLATLGDQASAGVAVVIATHDPDAAAPADAELRMDDGAATWVRSPGR
ncbi:MAG TPA: ATP-binding cassette domain-containing protein [Marmoricola sp.]|nr:ATP-binding cassette domain-containing protein [Marmoricola sp.]